jgi:imidazolonepropionase-like amidohydrolase
MTNLEAIRSATLLGAKAIGLDRELGSVDAGKLADLVVLDRNPLENIRNSTSISMVMLNGRLYDAKTLNEIGNRPRERQKLFWER